MSDYAPIGEMGLFPEAIDRVSDDKICCDKQFPTTNTTTGITTCISCKKKFIIRNVKVFSCVDCDIHNQETTQTLNLIKDEKTNWTSCPNCEKEVEYQKDVKVEFLE